MKIVSRRNKTKNPNSAFAWNKLLKKNERNLISSRVFQEKNHWVLRKIKKVSAKILDVGFGYGYLDQLITRSKKEVDLYGVDISDYAVTKAEKSIRGKFVKGNIMKIPFDSNYFDYVLVLDVLEHIRQGLIGKALSEVYRVTKKHGTVIVSVPLNETISDRRKNLHLRKYSYEILESELNKAGYKVNNHKFLVAFRSLYQIKKIISKILNIHKPNLLLVEAKK